MVLNRMAATQPIPAAAGGKPHEIGELPREAGGQRETAASQRAANGEFLVPASARLPESEAIPLSPAIARLPVQLDVTIPIRDFRVRTLLALEPGQLVESQWVNGEDVPLVAGNVQLAWSEFEVVDTQLAVRLTRLA
jgi:flagellar motor switch/type III secretory pathway protein FliN